jgi:hypothetical protein
MLTSSLISSGRDQGAEEAHAEDNVPFLQPQEGHRGTEAQSTEARECDCYSVTSRQPVKPIATAAKITA